MDDAIRATQVFIPGGMPEFTFVPREDSRLKTRLESAKYKLCKLITFTGDTKSGKTVLARRVYPRSEVVWIDGGEIKSEADIWALIVEQLNGWTKRSSTSSAKTANGRQLELGLDGRGTVLPVQIKAVGSHVEEAVDATQLSRESSDKTAAISLLRDRRIPLVIDDFHYLERPIQGSVVRGVKSLVFDGVPIIFIAIPHRRYDGQRVEKEMSGRIEVIEMPNWAEEELIQICTKGFDALRVSLPQSVMARLATESIGSPHLMQQLCLSLCNQLGIETRPSSFRLVSELDADVDAVCRDVAIGTGRVLVEKMAKGPRQRSDRLERRLMNGDKTDIYGLVLRALAKLRPGVAPIDYESDLRPAIRTLSDGEPPQKHEVSRVLEQMAKISASDESSAAVLDWDEESRRLHVTDPFFAFYLRWGSID